MVVGNIVEAQIPFLPMLPVTENVKRLAQYKWCICPEGNGVDTYRLWEAMYLGCVPIVLKSPFIDALMHYTGGELPIYVVDAWDKLCDKPCDKLSDKPCDKLSDKLSDSKWLKLTFFKNQITK